MAFSTSEKLAVSGAFLALVAMAVGTEDDPGVVASQASRSPTVAVRETPAAPALPPAASPDTETSWFSARGRPSLAPDRRTVDAREDPLPAGFGAVPPAELQK